MFTYNLCENTYLRKIEMRDAAELFALIDESREYLQDWLDYIKSRFFITGFVRLRACLQPSKPLWRGWMQNSKKLCGE